jgi:hypothetical protein
MARACHTVRLLACRHETLDFYNDRIVLDIFTIFLIILPSYKKLYITVVERDTSVLKK